MIAGYDPERSEDFHVESAKLADVAFTHELTQPRYAKIVLMAGGAASGKSEYAYTFLQTSDQLVYDGTLKHYSGFIIKSRNIRRYAKTNPTLIIIYILPANWKDSFEIFLSRTRKMKIPIFFETHAKSAQCVAQILRDTDCCVEIYVSNVHAMGKKMSYEKIPFLRRQSMADLLMNYHRMIVKIADDFGVEIR